MIFKEMKEMSENVTKVSDCARSTMEDISNKTKETLSATEEKMDEVVDEFKKLSDIAKVALAGMAAANVLSIVVSLVTLHKLKQK